jgi:hypothetical protein
VFNSKAFFIIVFLTTIILGAVLFFQFQEMHIYDLLDKLKKQYFPETSNEKVIKPVVVAKKNVKK